MVLFPRKVLKKFREMRRNDLDAKQVCRSRNKGILRGRAEGHKLTGEYSWGGTPVLWGN